MTGLLALHPQYHPQDGFLHGSKTAAAVPDPTSMPSGARKRMERICSPESPASPEIHCRLNKVTCESTLRGRGCY